MFRLKNNYVCGVREYYLGNSSIDNTISDGFSDAELNALAHYQNIKYAQYSWNNSIQFPEDSHHDCYIINNTLRKKEFLQLLDDNDCFYMINTIRLLDSALSKSNPQHPLILYKGIDSDFLSNKNIGDTYIDYGYGSYSLNKDTAKQYSKLQNGGMRIYICLKIDTNTHAIYMGDMEYEILLPRRLRYTILGIDLYKLNGEISKEYSVIIKEED